MIEWLNVVAGLILCVGFLEDDPRHRKISREIRKMVRHF